ncbi:MAG: hypothetical protein K8R23_11155 [Chthoniobacter sp.]|nr:hypothetical protein [Chthoniobacter sp.]
MKSHAVHQGPDRSGPALIALFTAFVAVVLQVQPVSAATFSFAGYSWDQDKTPNILGLIDNGPNLGGAQFTSVSVPSLLITRSVGFLATSGNANAGFFGVPGFNPTLTLGMQANAQHGLVQPVPYNNTDGSLFSSGINLPAGDNGTIARNGITITWSGGRSLANGPGDEFIIYESGSSATASEGQMVRVHLTGDGYSLWYYRSVNSFQTYTETPVTADGAFATVFDLTDLGLPNGTLIDQIQIANMMPTDRINTVGTFVQSGQVVFSDPGGTLAKPSVGTLPGMNPNSTFGATGFDPDPIYIGVIGSVVPEPAGATLLALGGTLLLRRPRRTPPR